jgi:LIM domain
LFVFGAEPSLLYDNNHYHEECLRCNSCGLNLTGPNQKRARRFKNQILCDLHFADVALMECSDFMQQLRSFKPQSLGCAVARRKSSTTLIFPLPPQACSGQCTPFMFLFAKALLFGSKVYNLQNYAFT